MQPSTVCCRLLLHMVWSGCTVMVESTLFHRPRMRYDLCRRRMHPQAPGE